MKKQFKDRNRILVIGSSRLGASIASMSSVDGIYTSIVDRDQNAFKKLDPDYSGYTFVGDATDNSILEKAHIDSAKEVVVATGEDNVNVLIASRIATLYDVPYIIVRLRDERKASLLNDDRISIISTGRLSIQAYKTIRGREDED